MADMEDEVRRRGRGAQIGHGLPRHPLAPDAIGEQSLVEEACGAIIGFGQQCDQHPVVCEVRHMRQQARIRGKAALERIIGHRRAIGKGGP